MSHFPQPPSGYDQHILSQTPNTQISILRKRPFNWLQVLIVIALGIFIGYNTKCGVAIQTKDGKWHDIVGNTPDSLKQSVKKQ